MNLIVAVDRNWGIGKDGDLLFHISADMKYFAKMTTGHTIVMGRKTLESFPGGRPLPKRINIVLTRDPGFDGKGAELVHTEEDLLRRIGEIEAAGQEVWVVGGGSIYKLLLPRCKKAYITKVEAVCQADTFMPDLDRDPDWKVVDEGQVQSEKGKEFRFMIYQNQNLL